MFPGKLVVVAIFLPNAAGDKSWPTGACCWPWLWVTDGQLASLRLWLRVRRGEGRRAAECLAAFNPKDSKNLGFMPPKAHVVKFFVLETAIWYSFSVSVHSDELVASPSGQNFAFFDGHHGPNH